MGKHVATTKELRILLLEDNMTDAELIVQELIGAGFSFIEKRAETREEFLDALRTFSPEIILADYTLPQFSALEAFELLKERKCSTPVILVTGSQSEEVAVECMKQGATDYLLKQSLTRLPAAILNVLEKQAIKQQKEQAELALRKSEEKFRLLFEHNPLPMFVYDIETLQFVEVNNAAVRHYEYSREEFSLMWITDLWALHDLQKLQATRLSAGDQLQVAGQWHHQRKTGNVRIAQVIYQPLEMEERKTALMIAEDITERAQAEERLRQSSEQLRALSAHLQSVREEERTRIAREIHDELGQILTAIRMDLSWLQDKLSVLRVKEEKTLVSHTASMIKLVDTTIQEVRKIATELRPRILDDLGLIAAIEWQAHEFQNRHSILCSFESNMEEIELDRERSTAVFRILQESLTNVIRHAHATTVKIQLTVRSDRLIMEIIDNGVGIKDERISNMKSLGLLGMQERAHLLGGSVAIRRLQKRGTSVTVQLPLHELKSPKTSDANSRATR